MAYKTMHRAVFLDRDGTVIEDTGYLHRREEVALLPGAAAALKRLLDAGFKLVFVTNQSGVGRGLFTLAEVEAVNAHLLELLTRQGVRIQGVYVAPEAPDAPSRGRKPSPQFLFDARDALGLDLGQSYMVGDKLIDLECGWNGGVKKSLLVRTGHGRSEEARHAVRLERAVVVDDLGAAADWILRTEAAGI